MYVLYCTALDPSTRDVGESRVLRVCVVCVDVCVICERPPARTEQAILTVSGQAMLTHNVIFYLSSVLSTGTVIAPTCVSAVPAVLC